MDSRHPVNAPPYSSAPTGAQATSPLVGSTPFTHTPHIVRIRAGQGPPDPQTPISHARTPLGAGMSVRPHEHGTSEAPPRPSTIQPILEYDMVAHSRMQNPPAHPHSQQSVGVTSQPTQHAHPVQPVRPPSTAPHAPTSSHPAAYTTLPAGLSRSQAAPSPAIHPPALPPKGPINFTKQVEMHIQANSSMSAAHFAKLSVYRAPDPPVSAHLVVPTVHGIPPSFTIHGSQSSDAHRSKLTAQDLSSKFPLNEDALASALTNAHSTARLAGTHPSSSTSQHHSRTAIVPEGMGNASQHGAQPPRSSTYPPPASSGNAFAPHAPSSSSPLRHQLPNPVDDTTPKANPLPIPEPKTPNMSTSQQQPVQAMQAGQAYDPRSPKQNLTTPAPIISSSPYQSSRLPVSPVQSKQPSPLPTPYPLGHSLADSAIASALPSRSVHPGIPPGPYQPSAHNYSPPRNAQYNQLRSPVVPNASSLAPATPKQSPSGRLHVRNGSNDTITQLPTSKPSPPKNPQNSLVQPSSIINLNSNVASRPDTIPIVARPSTSPGYPEPARYRSPPPTQYPFGSSSQQQHALHALPPNAVPYNPSLPSGTVPHLHSRSASHPVPSVLSVQVPSHDATANMQRGQSTPSVPVASTPSAASAIATAYRQQVEPGMRWSDMPTSATGFLSNQQRVPPRAVPSPAPTINGRSYPGMAPSAGPTSSTTPMNGPRPSRGHSVPAPARPATAQPSTIHSRSVSDPQNALQQSRVAVSGHPSTPSPTKGHLVPSSGAPEAELLKTPSSLAPSMLPPVIKVPLVSSSHVKEKTKEKEKVKEKERESRRRTGGFFGLFRSRSSPPKEPEVRPPVNPKPTGRPRASSHSTITAVAASMKNIVTPHPTHVYAPPPKPAPVPMPIVAPTPVPAAAMMEPGGKMYSPFRLLSKRNRTVSSASVEAQDGTAVSLNVFSPSAEFQLTRYPNFTGQYNHWW